MEIQIVLTTDNTVFARLARWLGAEWTHAMIRFLVDTGYPCATAPEYGNLFQFHVIEATMRHGVIERAWNPREYSRWTVYGLREPPARERYDNLLSYARGNIGKRYAYEKLALVLPRFIREYTSVRVARFDAELYRYTIFGTGQVCTSLVDDCFLGGGHFDLVPHLDTPWVLPDDIAASPLLEVVEEG